MNSSEKVLSGILAGAVIGIGLAVVFAPSPQKAMLKMVKKKSKHFSNDALDAAISFLENLREKYNRGVEAKAKMSKAAIDGIKDSVKI